jgi:hypothetical protein
LLRSRHGLVLDLGGLQIFDVFLKLGSPRCSFFSRFFFGGFIDFCLLGRSSSLAGCAGRACISLGYF